MRYLKAHWRHELSDEAVLWFHDLTTNDERGGRSSSNGRSERAGFGEATEYAYLSSEPLPDVYDTNSHSEFDAEENDRVEFEQAWMAAAPRSN